MQIAHVALWTLDLDRICDFWARSFGAKVGPLYESRNRPGFRSRFLSLDGGATFEVMTGPWVGPQAPFESRGYAHVALSLGSREAVDELAAKMQEEGALVAAPRQTGDGFYEAVLRDPDGNLIEITA